MHQFVARRLWRRSVATAKGLQHQNSCTVQSPQPRTLIELTDWVMRYLLQMKLGVKQGSKAIKRVVAQCKRGTDRVGRWAARLVQCHSRAAKKNREPEGGSIVWQSAAGSFVCQPAAAICGCRERGCWQA